MTDLDLKTYPPPSQSNCSLTVQTWSSFCVSVLAENLEGATEEAEMIHVQLLVSVNQRLG